MAVKVRATFTWELRLLSKDNKAEGSERDGRASPKSLRQRLPESAVGLCRQDRKSLFHGLFQNPEKDQDLKERDRES